MPRRKKSKNIYLPKTIIEKGQDIMGVRSFEDFSNMVEQLIREKHEEIFGLNPQNIKPASERMNVPADPHGVQTGLHPDVVNDPVTPYGPKKEPPVVTDTAKKAGESAIKDITGAVAPDVPSETEVSSSPSKDTRHNLAKRIRQRHSGEDHSHKP